MHCISDILLLPLSHCSQLIHIYAPSRTNVYFSNHLDTPSSCHCPCGLCSTTGGADPLAELPTTSLTRSFTASFTLRRERARLRFPGSVMTFSSQSSWPHAPAGAISIIGAIVIVAPRSFELGMSHLFELSVKVTAAVLLHYAF
jgi:hypothetical protein